MKKDQIPDAADNYGDSDNNAYGYYNIRISHGQIEDSCRREKEQAKE